MVLRNHCDQKGRHGTGRAAHEYGQLAAAAAGALSRSDVRFDFHGLKPLSGV